MNKLITFVAVICASLAFAHCFGTPYNPAAPPVQQVSYSSIAKLANLAPYLQPIPAPAVYAPAKALPAYAPARYGPAPSLAYIATPVAVAPKAYAPAYAPAPAPAYLPAPAPAYLPAPAYAPARPYGIRPTILTSIPAIGAEINPGPIQYKTINSPPLYSTVALPVAPADPVANLYVPRKPAYAPAKY